MKNKYCKPKLQGTNWVCSLCGEKMNSVVQIRECRAFKIIEDMFGNFNFK